MKKAAHIVLLALGLCVLAPVHAEEPAADVPVAEEQVPEVSARDWLELQSGGSAASSQPQTLSGDTMDKIHERYVKSFGHPLPVQFEREPVTAK